MWHRSHGLPGTLHTIWLLAGAAAPRLRTGQMKVIICEPWPPLLRSAPLCSALLPPIRCFNEECFSGAASRAGGPLTGSRRWRPCKSAFNSTSLSPLPSELVYSTLARSGGNAELIKSWLDCKKKKERKRKWRVCSVWLIQVQFQVQTVRTSCHQSLHLHLQF